MEEQIMLRSRWGPRERTVEDCAARMFSFLEQLGKCDAVFARQWLKCSKRLDGDLEAITVSIEDLRKLLAKGRIRRDVDKSVFEDMGFRSGRLWNGSENVPVHVSVTCGAYTNLPTLPAVNGVWVELPSNSAAPRLLRSQGLGKIMSIVVANWDPDWAWVSTYKVDSEIYQENPYLGQKVGWLTYVSDRYGQLPELPQVFKVTRLEDLGNLIEIPLTHGLSASNAEHVKAVRLLSEVLGKAGMLAPVPPNR